MDCLSWCLEMMRTHAQQIFTCDGHNMQVRETYPTLKRKQTKEPRLPRIIVLGLTMENILNPLNHFPPCYLIKHEAKNKTFQSC